MKKLTVILLSIVLFSIICLPAFCDDPIRTVNYGYQLTLENTTFKKELLFSFYKYNAATQYGYNLTEIKKGTESDFGIYVDGSGGVARLYLGVITRYIYDFNLVLNFSGMKMTQDGEDYYGTYGVTLYKPRFFDTFNKTAARNESLLNPEVDPSHPKFFVDRNGASVVLYFPPEGSDTAYLNPQTGNWERYGASENGRERWLYLIDFDFTTYYGTFTTSKGDNYYSATITVEVAPR